MVHRPEQVRPVSRRAEDVGVAGWKILPGLNFLLRLIFVLFTAVSQLAVILHNQGCLSVHPVVADLPPVLPGECFEGKC